MTDRSDRLPVHQDRLVASLKDVPIRTAEALKAVCESRLKPFHPAHQIQLWHLYTMVEIVAHQHPCMQHPTLGEAALVHPLQEALSRSRRLENVRPVVFTVDYVVDRTSKFDS